MREELCDTRLADLRDVKIDPNLPARERYAEYKRQLNNKPHDFMIDGYKIHETFDPEGPEFTDVVVRLFKD